MYFCDQYVITISKYITYYSFSLMLIHPSMSILQTHSLTFQKGPEQTRDKAKYMK